MAIIQANLDRNIGGQIGAGIGGATDNFFRGQENRRANESNDRQGRAQRLSDIAASFQVLDQMDEPSRAAGVRNMMSTLAQEGAFPLIQETLQSNPNVKGPTVDEIQRQLGVEAFGSLGPEEKLDLGSEILRPRDSGMIRAMGDFRANVAKIMLDPVSSSTLRRRALDALGSDAPSELVQAEMSRMAEQMLGGAPATQSSLSRTLDPSPKIPTPSTGRTSSVSQATQPIDTSQVSDEWIDQRLESYISQGFSEQDAVALTQEDIQKTESDDSPGAIETIQNMLNNVGGPGQTRPRLRS